MEPVPEPTPETETTELLSILKLETEDVLLQTETSSHAESMVDQTKMTSALKLMSNAQVYHTRDQPSETKVLNLPLTVDQQVTYGERPRMETGDHLLLTTSGIITMVPTLSVEIWASVPVLEPRPEDMKTRKISILKPVTEDVLLITITFFNAESMVDQTKMTEAPKLMSDVQDHHTRDLHSTESVQNSLLVETLAVDTFGEKPEMAHGDH